MKLVYTPEEGDKQTWDFDIRKLMVTELEDIEKVTDLSYLQFAQALENSSTTAFRALVWVMLKRTNADLRYSAVDFQIGALQFVRDEEPAKPVEDGEAPKGKAPRKRAAGA